MDKIFQKDSFLDLKKQLAQEVSKKNSDHSKILFLSQKLVAYDENAVRFSVDSGLITRLGQELVARQETAVSELVKNAYDADATEVKLRFIDTDQEGGILEIIDNGLGMSRNEIVNGFMRISSANKIENPFSPVFNRKRAGQKGIGRFAVQRLGSKLTIITKTGQNLPALRLIIDWDDYQNNNELIEVSHKLHVDNAETHVGTKLIIRNLRDKWSVASIKRIYRYVSDIIAPKVQWNIPEDPKLKDETNNEKESPQFNIIFNKISDGNIVNITNDEIKIQDFALASISAYIDNTGLGHYSVKSQRFELDASGEIYDQDSNDDINKPFDLLSDIRFSAFYFILKDGLVPKNKLSSIQNEAKKRGGIRLYRNGFRVLPYGENGDDWLKLDKSVRDRILLPPHANNNFFGFVEISDKNNLFCETSSREGLLENEAFIQLQNFLYKVIIKSVLLLTWQ